jgi:2-polyprenyl-3-methyl-5-hydroxy-6-metoxy-1,4-benzoquinol methylase
MKTIKIDTKNLPLIEGVYPREFMSECLKNDLANLADKRVLEIGPKHGIQTRFISENNPKEIVCVDLENKREAHQTWMHLINSTFKIHYMDMFEYKDDDKFDVILFNGVIYHLEDQMLALKHLYSLSKPGGVIFFESATARNQENHDKNIIEVYLPETYRNVPTVKFVPSKLACKSMIEHAGWKILAEDENIERERICLLAKIKE